MGLQRCKIIGRYWVQVFRVVGFGLLGGILRGVRVAKLLGFVVARLVLQLKQKAWNGASRPGEQLWRSCCLLSRMPGIKGRILVPAVP